MAIGTTTDAQRQARTFFAELERKLTHAIVSLERQIDHADVVADDEQERTRRPARRSTTRPAAQLGSGPCVSTALVAGVETGRDGAGRWPSASLAEAVAGLVRDGDSVAMEGFTHLIPFAAGHEVLRQGRTELELIRMTPDVLYDQMVGVGAARKLVFSYAAIRAWARCTGCATRSSTGGRARWSWRSTRTRGWRTGMRRGRRGCRAR